MTNSNKQRIVLLSDDWKEPLTAELLHGQWHIERNDNPEFFHLVDTKPDIAQHFKGATALSVQEKHAAIYTPLSIIKERVEKLQQLERLQEAIRYAKEIKNRQNSL